jgi:hypothetical protein
MNARKGGKAQAASTGHQRSHVTRIGRLSFAGTGRVRFRKLGRLKLSLTVSFISFALAGAQAGRETHLICKPAPTNTDLEVRLAVEGRILVDRLSLPERAPDCIEGG